MVTRRKFLLGSISVASGLGIAIGYLEWALPDRLPDSIDLEEGQLSITPYVVIDEQGIKIIAPRAEMGQGIHTTLAALVAEELDVELDSIQVIHGQPSELYSNTVAFGQPRYAGRVHGRPTQFTGGQSSIKDAFVKMRKAGATARSLFVKAAAEKWRLNPELLKTINGKVLNPAGEQLTYIELAPAAARLDIDPHPGLKPVSEWRILGKSQNRVDVLAKSTGTAQYAIDINLPGMLFATARVNPHLGGKMAGFDATRASEMQGVKKFVQLSNGVIVIATNTWYAMQAAEAIEFDWEPAPYPDNSTDHLKLISRELENPPRYQPLNRGNVDEYLNGEDTITGVYSAPYLAHATMEPMSATVLFDNGQLQIWAGTQNPTRTRIIGAKLAAIKPEAVKVHTTYMGGGFGRRLSLDFVEQAVHAALSMEGIPVKLTWTREEDMTHDAYRPMALARFQASVADQMPVALNIDVSALSLYESSLANRENSPDPHTTYFNGEEKFLSTGLKDQPYGIPNYRVNAHQAPRLLPVGFWRGVGESQNSFFHESIIDELAYSSQKDPLAMRMDLLEHEPSISVLEAVAEMSNWGTRLPEAHAQGVAYVLSSGAATAQVVQIEQTEHGIRIDRIFVAVDLGVALDPRNVESQIEGSLIYGLTAAIMGEITVSDGVVVQRNFHDYPMLRISNTPPIEIRIMESGNEIYGAGESGLSAIAPALGNAIFAATGQRIRELPFHKHVKFV